MAGAGLSPVLTGFTGPGVILLLFQHIRLAAEWSDHPLRMPIGQIQGAKQNVPVAHWLGFPRQLRQQGPELRHGEVIL